MLSFAVRELGCKGGIVITASHNPKIYNGYKAYDEFGCQLTDNAANEVIGYVGKVSDFSMIKTISEEEALKAGLLKMIGEDVDKVYIEKVKSLAINTELVKEKAKDLKIIYTPIHGSGNIPVRRVLKELGYNPADIMCHPDFKLKKCYYYEDRKNFTAKLKKDWFTISDYTVWVD